jgi:hypothetical protein
VQVGAVGRSEHFEAGVDAWDGVDCFVFHELNIARFGPEVKGGRSTLRTDPDTHVLPRPISLLSRGRFGRFQL